MDVAWNGCLCSSASVCLAPRCSWLRVCGSVVGEESVLYFGCSSSFCGRGENKSDQSHDVRCPSRNPRPYKLTPYTPRPPEEKKVEDTLKAKKNKNLNKEPVQNWAKKNYRTPSLRVWVQANPDLSENENEQNQNAVIAKQKWSTSAKNKTKTQGQVQNLFV